VAQINAIKIYMGRRNSTTSAGSLYAQVRNYAVDYTDDPGEDSLLGTSDTVAYNDLPVYDVGGPGWVTFTFSSPVTITTTGFYALVITSDDVSNYAMAVIRYYVPSDWSSAISGEPYTDKEYAYQKDLFDVWHGSAAYQLTYDLSTTDLTVNNAATYTATYINLSYSRGWGIRTYLVTEATLPDKAIYPSPTNGATQDPVIDYKLSWTNGDNTDTVDVYIGTVSGALSQIATGVTTAYYYVDEEDFPSDSDVYWRIDSVNDTGTTTGDEWYFDPRAGVATSPTPSDGATSISMTQSRLYWDAGDNYQTFDVYINGGLVKSDTTHEYFDLDTWGSWPLDAETVYTWYIDSKNVHSSQVSDTWTFTTAAEVAAGDTRPEDYNPDAVWDAINDVWVTDNSLITTGGGRYQSQIVVVGHKVIYFGSI
jgi:hypothetical protein